MSRIDTYAPGSFCWAELATNDQEAAKRFYSAMFGWTVRDEPIPGGVYSIFESGGNSAGAAYTRPANEPTRWNTYFSVSDVDGSASQVIAAGGQIIAGPFDVMDQGRMAVATDPQGAPFMLWQAKNNIGATHGGPLNQMCWPELSTPDPAGAVKFYSSLFDWGTQPATSFDTAYYIEWINAGQHIGGLMPMRGNQAAGAPPHWLLYVTVADCEASAAQARQLGANICVPPTVIPNVGKFSVITDPQGAVFSLIQRTT
jgi:predicted enzyme related to lactoylglutathione lyase